MWANITRTGTSFFAVVAAYWVYALIAVPLIEPSIAQSQSGSRPDHLIENDIASGQRDFLKNFFPEGSWQLGRTKLLESNRVVLLMKDFKEVGENTLELQPITILMFSNDDEESRLNEPPLILEAEKAMLRFDKLDLAFGKIGQVQGGHLHGNVKIHRNAENPLASDSVLIVTRDVQLTQQYIETENPVQFKLGMNSGSGKHLIAELLKSKVGGNKNGPNIKGLKSLQLTQVDRVQLVTKGKGIFGDESESTEKGEGQQNALKPKPGDKLNSDAPVEVTCAGPFLFDGVNNVASFRDKVMVRRLSSNANPDRLLADLLEVHFVKEQQTAKGSEEKSKKRKDSDPTTGKLKIARVVAVGKPAQLIAPSVESYGEGGQMIYDVIQRRVEISGSPIAILRRENKELRSPSLQYEFAKDPKQLGQIWAAGPGTFIGKLDSKKESKPVNVAWSNQLRVDLVNAEHVLTLDGSIVIAKPGEGQLTADKLTMWLRSTANLNKKGYQIRPDRLQAVGNVVVDSLRFSGNTPELKAWFQYAPPTAEQPKVPTQTVSTNVAPRVTPSDPQRVQTINIARTPKPAEPAPESEKSKFHMIGQQVQLVIKQNGKLMEIENATVSGQVSMKESKIQGATKEPLEVQGDVVQITHANTEKAQIHIIGNPGMVAGQGIQLYSKHLQLDQHQSRAWTDGPGQVVLPMERDLEGRKLAVPEFYTVVWQGNMNFQYDQLTLENGVEIRGRNHRVNTSRMVITLDAPVNFRDLKSKIQPQVRKIQCFGGVTMFGHTVENGQWQTQDYIEAKNLSVDQITGALLAQGPGYLRTTRFGFQNIANTQIGSTPMQNQPKAPQLGFLQVNFNREITGDIFKREITFHDVNQAVYGPVNDWNDVIDPNSIHGLGEDAVELTTEKLTVVQMEALTGKERPIEIYAIGNAQVRGRLYSAWADRITYSTTKGLLTLQGNGRNTARLTHQQTIGGSRQNAEAGTIMFWPKESRLKVNNAKYIDVNNLQSFGAPTQ